MKETRNEIINKAFKALEWISLIVLIIGVVYFVKDVWYQFTSSATGVTIRRETVEEFGPPTITFCFTPGAKESALKKNNVSYSQFLGLKEIPEEVNHSQFYDDVKYKIGRDFDFSFVYSNSQIAITEENLIVEEIYTFYFAMCYKVTMKFKIKPMERFTFVIDYNENLDTTDIPQKIDVYYTSEQNSYGIIPSIWSEGKVFKFSVKPKDNIGIAIEPYEHIKLDCNHEQDYKYNAMMCLSDL